MNVYTRAALAAIAVSLYYNTYVHGKWWTRNAENVVADIVFYGGCIAFIFAPFFVK